MKERVFKNWISSILGLLMVIFAGVLLFVDTKFDLSAWQVGSIAGCGILLIFAKDKLIDLLLKRGNNG